MNNKVAVLAGLAALAGCNQPQTKPSESADEAAAVSTQTGAEPDAAEPGELTCASPIRADDSADTLIARYGPAAQRMTVPGAEGMETPGVVLWANDPARRVEVLFWDDALTRPAHIPVPAESAWRVVGLAANAPLSAVTAANGRAFKLSGFGWDYGGMVTDLAGGALPSAAAPCSVVLRFTVSAELPAGTMGDGVTLSSDDPRLAGKDVQLDGIGLGFPAPEGME